MKIKVFAASFPGEEWNRVLFHRFVFMLHPSFPAQWVARRALMPTDWGQPAEYWCLMGPPARP